MNLPWYGWSRWTCFVRSRSGSAASDHERSRSSVAYSSSCVTATRQDSTLASERLRHALHAAVAHGYHVEAHGEAREVGTRAQPRLGRAAQPPLLLGRDHLERVAEPRALLLFDLGEAHLSVTAIGAGTSSRMPGRSRGTRSKSDATIRFVTFQSVPMDGQCGPW